MKRQQSKDRQGKERKGKARQGRARTGKARKGSKESNEAFDVILEAIVCRVKGSSFIYIYILWLTTIHSGI